MNDTEIKLQYLEARLTLVEQTLARLTQKGPSNTSELAAIPDVGISCDQPGMIISRRYPKELDDQRRPFCWIGNDGPIQIVLPVRPIAPFHCTLRLVPHPRADFTDLKISVNGATASIGTAQVDEFLDIKFDVAPNSGPLIELFLSGVRSVNPVEIGENSDDRLLAARFYGAELKAS